MTDPGLIPRTIDSVPRPHDVDAKFAGKKLMQPTANDPVNDARGMMRVGGVIALLALALIL
jgi:hypothetical protein